MSASEILESDERIETAEPAEELLTHLEALDKQIREETGGLVLFGLFERADTPGRWDLLVAADWVDSTVPDAMAYVTGKLEDKFSADELISLSGVIALPSTHPFVRQLLAGTIEVLGARSRVENCEFNGIRITRAWIFTADLNAHSRFIPPPYIARDEIRAKGRGRKTQKSAERRRR